MTDDTCLQESPVKKGEWLAAAQRSFPVGAAVTVTSSDVPEYEGVTGRVIGYDLGDDGAVPLVRVRFAQAIQARGWSRPVAIDGFLIDEIGVTP